MKNKVKIIKSLFAAVLTLSCVFGLASCGKAPLRQVLRKRTSPWL